MKEIRQLDLTLQSDFELMVNHIQLLYGELFGPRGMLGNDDIHRLGDSLRCGEPAHWAFLGLDDDGVPVAFFTLAETFAVFAHGVYGILNELWVRADARSRGVGGRVIEYCKGFAKGRGWQRIDVSAPPFAQWDRSFAFYQQQGFTLTGRKLKYLLVTQ